MRRRGWLEIMPGEDARSAPFRLTAQGERLLARVLPLWEKAQQEAIELLGADAIQGIELAEKRLRTPRKRT
jgi:DNA-binding MarR family transcriptional regulator